ncbi:copper amine oxidase N-terminal domain-containing protein [Paenibacillus kandeliae]|uniref:copper amine oxidase N-terminal domain-containing protein n=1 Tax=Paenibacillus kandeliae TaxID=3231269 RepID=UPI0034584450
MKTCKSVTIACLLLIFCTVSTSTIYASSEKPAVYFNNEKLDIFAGVGYAGVTYVPFRLIFQKFNMLVSWDNSKKAVTATDGVTTIVLTNNSSHAIVNGKTVDLIAPPFIDPTNKTFNVNLRFISETMGAKVQWSKKGNDASVYIQTAKNATL